MLVAGGVQATQFPTGLSFAMIGLVGCALIGCQKETPKAAVAALPEVYVELPTVEEVLDFEETTGRLVAREAVEIRSRVTGYLDKTLFADGANVQEGQPLFLIDARQYQVEFDRTAANVEQMQARLDRLKRQEERARKLFGTKNITQEEVDQISADRAEAAASLDSLIAAKNLAQLNLDFTRIAAPISGRISRRLIDPGNLIKADDTPLVTIMSLNPIYAYFDIDERTVLKFERLIREGKIPSPRDAKYEVAFALADEEDFSRHGSIDFLDNHISPTTGTLRLRATVQNDNLLLQPGLFIRLHVPIGRPHSALLIPEQALGSDQGQRYVYVLNSEDKAEYRRVRLGMLKEGKRVVEEGLLESDKVVVSGLQRIRAGSQVAWKFTKDKLAGTEKAEVETSTRK
jgi:RND family efflux transporter MFP subunit